MLKYCKYEKVQENLRKCANNWRIMKKCAKSRRSMRKCAKSRVWESVEKNV